MADGDRDASGTVGGSCFCGAVRFRLRLPSLFCCHCHCSTCRRIHGAGFVTWATVPRGGFEITGGSNRLVRHRSSDHGTRGFCGECGSSLFCESSRRPDQIDIVLANLADPIDRRPQAHIHCDDRAEWVTLDDGLPRLGGKTGLEPLDP